MESNPLDIKTEKMNMLFIVILNEVQRLAEMISISHIMAVNMFVLFKMMVLEDMNVILNTKLPSLWIQTNLMKQTGVSYSIMKYSLVQFMNSQPLFIKTKQNIK